MTAPRIRSAGCAPVRPLGDPENEPVVDADTLTVAALDWLLAAARPAGDGLSWGRTPGEPDNTTIYSGTAGVVLALLEAHAQLGDDRYASAALSGARTVAARLDADPDSGLYWGATGSAVTLDAVGRLLEDAASVTAAGRARTLVRERFDGERWGELVELLAGNAGIALGALACGDTELALLAVEPLRTLAETTLAGVTWQHRRGVTARLHHISHGALGIVAALSAVGQATGRGDLVEVGLAGAAEVLSRDEAGPDGFLVPHSDPPYRPEIIERYSYGWCHGPAGDAQVFRLLGSVTGDPAWTRLVERCWHTVTHSGLPARRRPGFWDNNGRCCGTAGVLAFALDRHADTGTDADLAFAHTLVEDLTRRATLDPAGARWSNHEHRETPSDLAPQPGWAMGNAGIVRELLRYTRAVRAEPPSGYAVPWPDQPPPTSSPAGAESG